MGSSCAWFFWLFWLVWPTCATPSADAYGLRSRQTTPDINITQYIQVPQCAKDCAARVLAAHGCLATDPCFCQTTGPQVDAIQLCLTHSCTLEALLAAKKFQADSCHFPVRNRGNTIAVTTYFLFSLATLFVLTRLVSRMPSLHGAGYGVDDFLIIFCYVPMLGLTIVASFEDHYGSGRDVWDVPASYLQPFALWFYIGEPMYIVATYGMKLSLVFIYIRIWNDEATSSFRITCWIVAASLVLCAAGTVLAALFPCKPISYAWRQAFPGVKGSCVNRNIQAFTLAGINIAYDIIVLLTPIPRFIGMKIPLHTKIGVCSCFLVGFIVTVISIVRLTTILALDGSSNPTYDYAAVGFWSLVEVYCGMICSCMPAFAGFLRRLWGYVARGQGSEFVRGAFSSKATESSRITDGRRGSGVTSPDLLVEVEMLENGKVVAKQRPLPVSWHDAELDRPRPVDVDRFLSSANVWETAARNPSSANVWETAARNPSSANVLETVARVPESRDSESESEAERVTYQGR